MEIAIVGHSLSEADFDRFATVASWLPRSAGTGIMSRRARDQQIACSLCGTQILMCSRIRDWSD